MLIWCHRATLVPLARFLFDPLAFDPNHSPTIRSFLPRIPLSTTLGSSRRLQPLSLFIRIRRIFPSLSTLFRPSERFELPTTRILRLHFLHSMLEGLLLALDHGGNGQISGMPSD